MPLPTGTTGGSGRSRSEAAIEAWKHRQRAAPKTAGGLDPKIAARVKEILASKVKGKKKAKDGKPKAAKPKLSDAEKQAAKDQKKTEADTAKAAERGKNLTKVGDDTDLGDHLANMDKFKQGKGIKEKDAAELEKRGLVERGSDGTPRLSSAGNAVLAAAARGDSQGAKEAASRGRDAAAGKQERDKAKVERVAAQASKQQATLKKQKQAAQAQRAKAKAGAAAKNERTKQQQAKQGAAQERKKRVLAEKVKRSEKLSASDQIDAEDAGIVKAGKALDMSELAIKAGARHSRTDMQHLQGIHDSAVACGASCATESDDGGADDSSDEGELIDAGKAIKGIMDNPLYYAQHECGDIMQAANALSTMAMLIQSELMEDDEDPAHVAMLCDAAHTLVDFIDSELDELEGASKDAAHDAGMGPMKAITERDDVNPKAGIAEYGKVTFADAKNKKYPIDTADHVKAAWNYIAKEANAAKYDPDEVSQIKSKIVSAWKKLIDKAGPPSAGKAIDDLLELNGYTQLYGSEIKSIGEDTLRGYAVRFGDADHADLQRDYYTKSTDFWLDHFGWPRPITYHHGMDAQTRNDPVIGHWLKAGVDDVGVWMEGQMDRAHAYYKAMKELAQRGYLRLSSDSAPQWVIRERQQNGVNEIKRWPLVTSSVTVTPMEPRMLPVEVKAYLAEIGMDIDDSQEAINPDDARHDGAKASDDERARKLLLEWELFNFEMETA